MWNELFWLQSYWINNRPNHKTGQRSNKNMSLTCLHVSSFLNVSSMINEYLKDLKIVLHNFELDMFLGWFKILCDTRQLYIKVVTELRVATRTKNKRRGQRFVIPGKWHDRIPVQLIKLSNVLYHRFSFQKTCLFFCSFWINSFLWYI